MTFAIIVVGVVLMQTTFCAADGRHMHHPFGKYEEHLGTSMHLKEGKWYNLFKVFDLDHNKIFNKDDVNIQWNVFESIYSMEGFEAESVKERLFMFWGCLLHGFEKGLSMEEFLAKGLNVHKVHQCLEFLIDVIDQNNDGFISVLEFDAYMKSLNLGNEFLVQKRFETICAEPVQRCPVEKFFDAWAEEFTGDDIYSYELIKNDYKTSGMPLDKLVE